MAAATPYLSSAAGARRPSHRKGSASLAASSNQDGSLQSLIRQTSREHVPRATQATQGDGSLPFLADLDNPSSAGAAYLASLTTQTLASLQSQPELFTSSSSKLNDQLAALCQRQISSFVSVHESTSSLPPALDKIRSSLEVLDSSALPQLIQAASAFEKESQHPLSLRHRAKDIIESQSSALPDLLDIPDLIAACTRGGYHAEAIQLGAYVCEVARAGSRLGGGSVLQSLKRKAWAGLCRISEQLLRSFDQKTLRQASVRRAVSNLRSLRDLDQTSFAEVEERESSERKLGLSEDQICLAFLRGRTNAVRNLLGSPIESQRSQNGEGSSNAVAQNLAAAQLSAYIDVWRQCVAETCQMATQVFPDAKAMPRLLSAFLRRHVKLLHAQVGKGIKRLVGNAAQTASSSQASAYEASNAVEELATSLLALHSQLSFAASVASKWGADCSALFSETHSHHADTMYFEEAAIEILRSPLRRAVELFQRRIPSVPGQLPSSWLFAKHAAFQETLATNFSKESVQAMSTIPILAHLCNDLLIGLNAFSTFAPSSLHHKALFALDRHLSEATSIFTHYCQRLPEHDLGSASSWPLPVLLADDEGQVSRHSNSPQRRAQAERLLAARALQGLMGVLMSYVRNGLNADILENNSRSPAFSSEAAEVATRWTQEIESAWEQGEASRRLEVQQDRKIEQARREREDAQRKAEEEEKARKEAEAKRKAEEEEKAREEAEMKAKEEAEARSRAEAEARSRQEAELRAREEAEAKARAEQEARVKEEGEAQVRREREEKIHEDTRARAQAEAEAAANGEREEQAKAQKLNGGEETNPQKEGLGQLQRNDYLGVAQIPLQKAGDRVTSDHSAAQGEGSIAPTLTTQDDHSSEAKEASPTATADISVPQQVTQENAAGRAVVSDKTAVAEAAQTGGGTSAAAVAGPPKKMTLAEKLKARAEERQRQAAVAAQSTKAQEDVPSAPVESRSDRQPSEAVTVGPSGNGGEEVRPPIQVADNADSELPAPANGGLSAEAAESETTAMSNLPPSLPNEKSESANSSADESDKEQTNVAGDKEDDTQEPRVEGNAESSSTSTSKKRNKKKKRKGGGTS
ncbi:unnamed protein product [Jaminaea pallidilutea]